MPNTQTATTATAPRLHTITLAHIVGDSISYSKARATSHAAALKKARETTTATVRAFYSPFGASLPLAAMHVTSCTLGGIAKRAKPVNTAQEAVTGDNYARIIAQLGAARHTLHAMAQQGPKAVEIPFDIQDLFQTAALALLNHTAPLAFVMPCDIQEAYSAAMCAVQKAYRNDTRGIQQAKAGEEMPRTFDSPTMPRSTPPRPAPQAYKDAIAKIRAAYIAQARDKEAAARVMDYWIAYPECTSVDMAAALKLNQSNASRRMNDIRRIASALYPNGVSAH